MEKSNKVLAFLKRNAVYIVVALCIFAVGLSVALGLLTGNKTENVIENPIVEETPVVDPTPVVPDTPVDVVDPVVEFILPVENYTELRTYSDTMVFNSTLKRYSSHMATDFIAPEGTSVICVYDGVVESVDKTLLEGVSITIDHGKGLKTVYNSLADIDGVTVGSLVKKGQVIGEVSSTNRQESSVGAHLHFEVIENGESIDPVKYMTIQEK